MKVILLRGIKKLGVMGDIKEVADGYGRNYLLPKKWVKIATPKTIQEFEMRKRTRETRKVKMIKEEGRILHKLQEIKLQIPMKMVEKDKLYGSVNAKIVSEALRNKGFEVNDNQISIPKTIKKLGEHSVDIRLGEKSAALKLNIVAGK